MKSSDANRIIKGLSIVIDKIIHLQGISNMCTISCTRIIKIFYRIK